MTPIVRPCELKDLPAVLGLLTQLEEVAHAQSDLKLERLRELFVEMAERPEIYLNLVCEADGQVAGFLSMIFYRTFFHRGGTALVNELVVDGQQRGLGLGQLLMQTAITEALARDMDEIEVGTEEDNQAAQAFYSRAGLNERYVLLGMEFETEE
ncbi:MAG TPA: GNAT family N-acetyltransferase [Anaerolineaceae bacterium]|nr:GNAT family N-acetyltransferase [Anaerolineaceae bacterium]